MKPTALADVIRTPSDLDTQIWRYMDFTKFVAMLVNKGLFFPRSHLFDDPFEGSSPRGNEPVRRESLAALDLSEELIADRLRSRSAFYRWHKNWVLVNCWHMGPCESAALWQLYGKTSDAICIVSTYKRLRECLPQDVLISEVGYLDYDRATLEEGNVLFPFVHKRQSFAHERELRALAFDNEWPRSPAGGVDMTSNPPDPGRWILCDLANLVERILVAPQSADWYFDLVRRVTQRYELNARIDRSALDAAPFF